jgi:hypothetical protein
MLLSPCGGVENIRAAAVHFNGRRKPFQLARHTPSLIVYKICAILSLCFFPGSGAVLFFISPYS